MAAKQEVRAFATLKTNKQTKTEKQPPEAAQMKSTKKNFYLTETTKAPSQISQII